MSVREALFVRNSYLLHVHVHGRVDLVSVCDRLRLVSLHRNVPVSVLTNIVRTLAHSHILVTSLQGGSRKPDAQT